MIRFIAVLMDTGGNAAPHLSVDITLLCDKYGLVPWYLPAYTTKVMMPLDQQPNNDADRLWNAWRRKQDDNVNAHKAVERAELISSEAYGVGSTVRSGWKTCGFVPWDDDSVVIKEQHLFKRPPQNRELRNLETPEALAHFGRKTKV